MSTDSVSLPQNKAPFGSYQSLKICLHGRTYQFFRWQNLVNLVSSCLESHKDSKTIEISWKAHLSWPKNGRKVCYPNAPRAAVRQRQLSSYRETPNVLLHWPEHHNESARATCRWPKHSGITCRGCCWEEKKKKEKKKKEGRRRKCIQKREGDDMANGKLISLSYW